MRIFAVIVLGLLLGAPAVASPFRALNRLDVVPINAESFEVIESRGAGASDIWCAASDYARAAGLDGLRKRMYVLVPRGPAKTVANAKGVVFTVNPDDVMRNTPSSYSVTVKRAGENLAISHAYEFCDIFLDERFERF